MATLQNSVQNLPSFSYEEDPSSFQEVFNTCYSHGLESIYKLENVDLKSVRKLSSAPILPAQSLAAHAELIQSQLEMDLGPFYRGWQVPYTDHEPIQVLQLPKPVEKILLCSGLNTLGVLKQADLHRFKLGQGHIEEVRSKLKAYLNYKPEARTLTIDFLSLIKCFFADKENVKAYVVLEPFGLHEWIFLTPSESMDIKRSSEKVKEEWVQEIKMPLMLDQERISRFFSLIVDTWVRPWIYARGLVSREELDEYLVLRSKEPSIAKKALELFASFSDIYGSLNDLGGYFAAFPENQTYFSSLLSCIKTYFVHFKTEYVLEVLSALVSSEMAISGIAVTHEHIVKLLTVVPSFELFRNKNGIWSVKRVCFQ